jgi:hypothetical protein
MANPDLKTLNLHFILGKERTGSSMLTTMLNESESVLSPSEEPFLIFFHNKYSSKQYWSKPDLEVFLKKFWLMHEKSLEFYFSDFEVALNSLQNLTKDKKLSYLDFCKCVYLQFLPQKDKAQIKHIVDKQLKYPFYLKKLKNITDSSKIVFITRDPRDNVTRCQGRKIGKIQNTAYQAQLWNEYYKNIKTCRDQFGSYLLILKYEDLVSQPQESLLSICNHLNLTYSDKMLDFNQTSKEFLEKKLQTEQNQEFGNKIVDFHSSLLQPLDKDKIGGWKNHSNKKDIKLIENITHKLANELGYKFQKTNLKLSITDHFMVILAKINKTLLLKFYLVIPFDIKILIKKMKRSQIKP